MSFMALLSIQNLQAQSKTFNLADYKNPKYFYQSLDLNFGLNSELSVQNSKSNFSISSDAYSLNSSMGANYTSYVNSEASQGEKHINFNFGLGSSGSDNSFLDNYTNAKDKNKTFSHQEGVTFMGLHRAYNQKQQYFETQGSLEMNYHGNSDHGTNNSSGAEQETKSTLKRFISNITGGLRVGTGRIEQVQDARLALYLLDDLQLLNREKRAVTHGDVIALAQLITNLKYKRFFDSRLRTIAEITAIDSFMQKNGLAGSTDAAYFTSINDNWNFANNPIRNNGHRLYAGVDASLGYNYLNNINHKIQPQDSKTENTVTDKTIGLFLVAGYDYEKPVNLKWQNSADLSAKFGMLQQLQHSKLSFDTSSFYTEAIPSVQLSAGYGWGYYPNSRTWLTLKWWLLSGWEKQKRGESYDTRKDLQNSFYAYTGPQFQAYYYLSERLRLSLTVNGEFRLEGTKYTYELAEGQPDRNKSKWWNQQVNAGLTYGLF